MSPISPWTVIGWIIVVMILARPVIILIEFLVAVLENLVKSVRHLISRSIAPKVGQVWMESPKYGQRGRVEIASFSVDKGFRVSLCGYYTNLTQEQWKERVKRNRSYLVKKA